MGSPSLLDEGEGLVEFLPAVVGQGQHDVPADVVKAGLPGHLEGGGRLAGGVGPPEGAQLAVPGRLHPDGQAVDPGGPVALQPLQGDGLGVGLQGYLGPGAGRGGRDQPGGLGRRQQAGGAPAQIDGVGRPRQSGGKAGQGPQQGVHIGVRHGAGGPGGVKIAVPAPGKTVGDMKIYTKRQNSHSLFMNRSFLYSIL